MLAEWLGDALPVGVTVIVGAGVWLQDAEGEVLALGVALGEDDGVGDGTLSVHLSVQCLM